VLITLKLTEHTMTEPVPVVPRATEPEPAEVRNRPGIRKLAWYTVGGSLPPRYNAWVLHDVTCRTWWLRHFARVFAILAPFAVAGFLIIPSSAAAARFTGIAVLLGLVLFSVIFMLIDTDRRAVRAGYSFSVAADMRSRRSVDAQRASSAERRERIYARRMQRKNR
jgi:hypothetical protein